MLSTLSELRALDRKVFLLAVARMIATWGFAMVLPLMMVHLTGARGLPVWQAGLIMTGAGLCGAFANGYAGMLADRLGRVPLLFGSSLMRTLVLGLIGCAVAYRAPIPVMTLLLVINGGTRAFFDAPSQALIADLVPPAQRVSAFALQRMGINIGFAAGPAMGGLGLSLGVPYHQIFFWSVPISLAAVLAILPLRRGRPPTAPRANAKVGFAQLLHYRHDRAFMAFLGATFAFFILQVQLFTSLPVFAAQHLHLSHPRVMSIFAVNGLLVVLLQIPAAAIINRIGRGKALIVGCLGYALAYASVGLVVDHTTLLIAVAAITISEVILAPTQHAMVTSMAPAGHIGAYAGLFGLCQIAGQATGPAVGTALLDALPDRVSWIFLGLFGVLAAAGYRTGKTGAHQGDEPRGN